MTSVTICLEMTNIHISLGLFCPLSFVSCLLLGQVLSVPVVSFSILNSVTVARQYGIPRRAIIRGWILAIYSTNAHHFGFTRRSHVLSRNQEAIQRRLSRMENATAPAQSHTFEFQLLYVHHFTKRLINFIPDRVSMPTLHTGFFKTNLVSASLQCQLMVSSSNTNLDGSPILNLASFVQTYMPPMADKLVKENISKNLVGASTFKFDFMSAYSTHLSIRCRRISSDSWVPHLVFIQSLRNMLLIKSYCLTAVSWFELVSTISSQEFTRCVYDCGSVACAFGSAGCWYCYNRIIWGRSTRRLSHEENLAR